MILRQQLLHGHHHLPLSSPIISIAYQRCPPLSCLLIVPTIPCHHLQIRLKSKPRKPPPSWTPPPPTPPKKSTTRHTPIRPTPAPNPRIPVYEKLTPTGTIFADLLNWRHSRLLLSVLVNSATFVIFCLWVYEAHRVAQLKPTDGTKETSEGHFVPAGEDSERFVTNRQEWLLDNFTITPINTREGRYQTMFTSLFSHQLAGHAFINMVAAHFLFTGLCPIFGTIPVTLTFLAGGLAGNALMSGWMSKRGEELYKEKFPGQFYGALGMSTANLSVLGFAGSVYPSWPIQLWGVVPLRVGWMLVGIWVYEVFRYWQHTGVDKIQASVTMLLQNHMLMIARRTFDGIVGGSGARTNISKGLQGKDASIMEI